MKAMKAAKVMARQLFSIQGSRSVLLPEEKEVNQSLLKDVLF